MMVHGDTMANMQRDDEMTAYVREGGFSPRAIFFDVDGTLVSHRTKRVPPSAVAALAELRRRGCKVFVATGRSMPEFVYLPLQELTFDGYVLVGGQEARDGEGNVIFADPIVGHDLDVLLEEFRACRRPILFYESVRMYANFVNDHVRRVEEEVSTPVPPIDEPRADLPVLKAIIYEDDSREDDFMARLPGCKATRWHRGAYDVVPAAGGKVAGIQALLDHFGIAREQTMAFGDGENDADMLRFVRTGVAMGNCDDEARAAADVVCGDIDEDGLACALADFGLIDPLG